MATVLVQVRVDAKLKAEVEDICHCLGIELADYLRMCIYRLVQEGGIPFDLRLSPTEMAELRAKWAKRDAQEKEHSSKEPARKSSRGRKKISKEES